MPRGKKPKFQWRVIDGQRVKFMACPSHGPKVVKEPITGKLVVNFSSGVPSRVYYCQEKEIWPTLEYWRRLMGHYPAYEFEPDNVPNVLDIILAPEKKNALEAILAD